MIDMSFQEWIQLGTQLGYMQEIDRKFRQHYDIKQETTEEQWEELKQFIRNNA